MKRLLPLVSALLVAFLPCGCSSGGAAETEPPAEAESCVTLADLRDPHTVRFAVRRGADMTTDRAEICIADENGRQIPLMGVEKVSGVQATVTTGEALSIDRAYTLRVKKFPPVPIVPITYFGSADFAAQYGYDGPLGVELTSAYTNLLIWAPTASAVTLNLYESGSGGAPLASIPMEKGERGVWRHTENKNLAGLYYTYTVKTALGEEEAVDPYAVSAGLNGTRGMILDLAATDPPGWTEENFVPLAARDGQFRYTDAEIWEIHIGDFSRGMARSKYRGKYLAFTETGLVNEAGMPVGVDYLKELGITHVHLLPAFDFASVDESDPAGRNWGYDPQNYNVPEGSYSTDPAHGEVRVREFKEMVQALHRSGIGVIMDVVYNHTYDLGSNLNKIVPYYYYRYQTNGKPSEGSGCGNETASERTMVRRYMRDSVLHWLKEYNLDGFRFDLMGLHDIETMREIESAVHAVNPNAILYGEGWTGGSTTLPAAKQAVLANIGAVNEGRETGGIAMFNDALRDALKGSARGKDTGWATGAEKSLAGGVLFGLNGGVGNEAIGARNSKGTWSAPGGANTISYASAHDDLTLWDKICSAYGEGEENLEARLRRNLLCAAAVQMSLGVPFMQAGEEMLRTKKNADGSYNPNSYNASDEVNVLRWELLSEGTPQQRAAEYYRGLIAFRRAHEILRSPQTEIVQAEAAGETISLTMRCPGEKDLFLVFHAGENETEISLPAGKWQLFIDGERAGTVPIGAVREGVQKVGAISCQVYAAE